MKQRVTFIQYYCVYWILSSSVSLRIRFSLTKFKTVYQIYVRKFFFLKILSKLDEKQRSYTVYELQTYVNPPFSPSRPLKNSDENI